MKKYQYRAIHTAVKAVWGMPSKCELCQGINKSKRYEWSNKDHKYSLDRKDWWELCATCHRRYDREEFDYPEPWNKGKSIKMNNALDEYRKNNGAWNKGMRRKREVKCACGNMFYPPKKTSMYCSKLRRKESHFLAVVQ